jgi:hypothetical protein
VKPGNSSGETFDAGHYQLPQQDWTCGHHCEGTPCAIGPNGSGACLVAQICTPMLSGSGWQCTRPKAFGGKCKEGPLPDPDNPDQAATCPHQPVVCQPQRTLRSKRRLITGITAAVALGFCLVILGGGSRDGTGSIANTSPIISPGELSAHHGTLEQGCAACHSAASASPLDLMSCVFGGSGGLEDSRKCLKCHHEFGEHALHPHSVSPDWVQDKQDALATTSKGHSGQQMLARLLDTHATTETGELACSSCHVEHRGAAFNLKELTNRQCQTCHSSSFHSFADGHPEFTEPKRAFLHFDHSTHLMTHFNNGKDAKGVKGAAMSCSDCHAQDATGTSMVLASFETTCAQCHAAQITDDHMPLTLRMKGTEFFRLAAEDITTQTPFMELMLLAGRDITKGSQQASIQSLTDSLITQRETFVAERLGLAPDVSLDDSLAAVAARRLNESGFFIALKHAHTALTTDAAAPEAAAAQPGGAWSLSTDGRGLIYRSRGHADPLLRDWLNLAADGLNTYPRPPATDSSGAFDRLFHQLAAPEAAGHCMKCHTVDTLPDGQTRINWNSRQIVSAADGFTKFAHGPHVTLLSSPEQAQAMGSPDNRCETCHAVRERDTTLRKPEFLLEDWMPNPDFNHPSSAGLTSVTRQSCVNCHTASQAGDSCLQCHNYHIHPSQLGER